MHSSLENVIHFDVEMKVTQGIVNFICTFVFEKFKHYNVFFIKSKIIQHIIIIGNIRLNIN